MIFPTSSIKVHDFVPKPGSRRLIDKVLLAVHHACDQGKLDVARSLLGVAEVVVKENAGQVERRKSQDALVAAHERLWELQRPNLAA